MIFIPNFYCKIRFPCMYVKPKSPKICNFCIDMCVVKKVLKSNKITTDLVGFMKNLLHIEGWNIISNIIPFRPLFLFNFKTTNTPKDTFIMNSISQENRYNRLINLTFNRHTKGDLSFCKFLMFALEKKSGKTIFAIFTEIISKSCKTF